MSDDKNKHRGYTEDSKLNTSDDSLEGRWSNIQSDYRKKFPVITESDTAYKDGEFGHMIKQIADRTNRSEKEVEDDIRNWNY